MTPPSVQRLGAILACALLLAGCAGEMAFRRGQGLIEEGKVGEGIAELERATKEAPSDVRFRSAYYRQRELQVNQILAQADLLRGNGRFEAAEDGYQRALEIAPDSQRATAGLEATRMAKAHALQVERAEALLDKGDADGALAALRGVLVENPRHPGARQVQRRAEEKKSADGGMSPVLRSSLKQPVTIELRDASLKAVLEILSRTANINFIVDRDVRTDVKTTVFVKNASVEDVLQFVLVVNQLEKKVLSENSVLIFPNTPAKSKDYLELTMRTFYLSNADVKQTAAMIKALVKTKDVYVDDKLNMLVVRDTPDAVRTIERLIALQDKPEPEVTLAVEVLEVSSARLQEIGIRYPGQASFSVAGAGGIPGQLTLPEFRNRNSDMVTMNVTDPLLVLNLRAQDGGSKLLANPRIRVKNREKAKIHIGDRVPVITSTSTSTGFVSETVNYLDVGLKLDVEPNVFLEGDVGIRMGLEVSNIVNEIASKTGSLTYRVGTRNASTTLRLRDGETQILAGLISDEERNSADKVPGLGDLPMLGRLFSSHKDTKNRTEIVLLVTPYIVRNIDAPAAAAAEFPSGTESNIGAVPLQLRAGARPPVVAPPVAPAAGARTAP
ncbi:MAG TPA: secretin N-terminal domain-containing protein [Ramlibacter sp.]|uniref:secretin N-terminal domain-containing protein n=1 Tax=Ramlibacter sp. TaxID=1917967 RepID=UPI002ED3BD86